MIFYFADRKMNILGQASTSLPKGVIISNDRKTEEVDEGVAILEFDLEYDPEWRKKAEAWTEAGNYILRKDGDDREFYTIISREKDPVNGSVNDIYAEDAGLDLLNEVVGAYKADKAYSAEFYIKKFSYDSGFEVGVNEVSNLTRKLSWDGEATATERLLSVATQFDNAEISFSFDVDRMSVVHKYINIFKRRGVDSGVQLQIGREIKKIRIKDTIEDLATAYVCTGGIPDGKDDPITLAGYKYDDGDFYVEGTHLNSRKALQKWSRYQIKTEMGDNVGHIVKTFSYDTTSQSELCNRAVSSLKKICDVNTTYEIELSYLPRGTKIGDTVYIIDHTGELYLSSRLLKIETSVCDNTKTAELGEYSVKSSGVSEKLRELADAFAKVAQNRKFYTWIAYADDDIGTGASLDSYGKEYLGIASNRVTRDPDLTDPTVYTWIKIRGEQGTPGTSGKDGKTSYFHVKYSDVEKPASYSDMTETPAKYIGTYVDYELEDSKDPSKYTWSKFQGEDGTDGIPGKNGENGETSYVHFAYATSEDGKTSFSTTDPTDKTYIGQYVDFKKVDSEQPEKYRWSKFQGPKGPAGSDGEQGYGIVASVTRENFTEDQWNSTYGMTGHLTSWTGTSTLRNGCRIGDIFVVVGTATDTKNAHTAYYRSDTDAGDLQGICIGHTIAFRGSAGVDGTDGKGIESIKEHYAVSTSNTVTPTVWFDDVLVTNSVNKYLWSYETIIYTDGTSVDSKKRVIGVYGDTGKDGARGVGVSSVDVMYYKSTSATSLSGGSWVTTDPGWENGKYIWSKTVITYTDKTIDESTPVCITGAKGSTGGTGAKGETGATGKGVSSIVEQYYQSTSAISLSGGSWSEKYPGWTNGKYIWTRSVITYTDKTTTTTTAVCVTGAKGSDGNNGKSIGSVINYYLATSASSGVSTSTSGWTTTVQNVTLEKKYLWNYEVVKYTDGTVASTTSPCIIGTYGDTGKTGATGKNALQVLKQWNGTYTTIGQEVNCPTDRFNRIPVAGDMFTNVDASSNLGTWKVTKVADGQAYFKMVSYVSAKGATGATGNGIKSIKEHYAVSTSNTVTPTSWLDDVPVTNPVNKYLWNYETITYTNGTSVDSKKRVIGVYGDTGKDGATGATGVAGKGVTSIVEQYYKSTSATALSGGSWATTYPGWESGKYIWTRSVITYTDKTTTTTTAVCVTGTKGSTGNDGKNATYITVSGSNYDTVSASFGVVSYISINGTKYNFAPTRGHTLAIVNPANGNVESIKTYDTYTDPTLLEAPLNAVAAGKIICLFTADASGMTQSARNVLISCGSARTDIWTAGRVTHLFIGMKGLAKGNAYELKHTGGGGTKSITAYYTPSGIVLNGAKGETGATGAKGETGATGAPGKDANQVVHSVAGNGNTNKYIEFATVKVNGNYVNHPTTFKISGREYETTDVQFMFQSSSSNDPKLSFIRATGEWPIWMYKKSTSTWGIITKLNEVYGYMRVYNYQLGKGQISVAWTDTRHASLPSGCVAADQLQAAKTATNFMEFTSGTGLQIGDKTNGSWKGFRSRITSTAFEILNEVGAAVASYGRKLIQLGKDTTDAVIELCGGKGIIKYAEEPVFNDKIERLTIEGDYVALHGKTCTNIYAYNDDHSKQAGISTDINGTNIECEHRRDGKFYHQFIRTGPYNATIQVQGAYGDGGISIYASPDGSGCSVDIHGNTININGKSFLDRTYPVGSIYMSTSATNPTNLFGGTWVAWGAGRVPVGFNGGDGNFNSSEKTGGSKTINIQHNHGLSNARAAVGRADSSTSTISYTAGGNPHNVYFDREFSYWGGIAGVSKHATDTAKIYGNTDNGGSTAASVLQPYITCYMWKRTA